MESRWVHRLVGEKGLERIRVAVREAESQTSAEIVPMIVHRSIAIGHVPWLVFLVSLLIFWGSLPFLLDLVPYGQAWHWELVAVIVSGLISIPIGRLSWVARLLTPASDERESVDRRALLEFHLAEIASTQQRTGVLIFVSLLEHRAVVLTDRTIAQKFPSETWRKLIEELIVEIRKGDFTGGMCAAIGSLGKTLAREFPALPGDRNELSNRLVVKN